MIVTALSGLDSNLILTLPLAGIVAIGALASWWYSRWRRRRLAAEWIRVKDQFRRAVADERQAPNGAGS